MFRLIIGFTEHLQPVTTSKVRVTTVIHILQHVIARTYVSLVCGVFVSLLVNASNDGLSSFAGSLPANIQLHSSLSEYSKELRTIAYSISPRKAYKTPTRTVLRNAVSQKTPSFSCHLWASD